MQDILISYITSVKFDSMLNKSSTSTMRKTIFFVTALLITAVGFSQSDSKKKELIADANTAKAEFIKADSKMAGLFSSAYGYVIFPNVGKGAVGVGGASGNGVAYENGAKVGMAKMKQVSVGFQFGGQAYREVIFFENKEKMDRFKENRVELSAQVSAVAASAGASANAKYVEGVMVFTMQKGGLMYEAAVGGQKFKFEKD
jgi:lipid-binding SYLF domain-containing protein